MLCNKFLYSALLLLISGCSVQPLYNDAAAWGREESSSVKVDVIAGRSGQKLRSYLQDYFRDIQFTNRKLRLSVTLNTAEKSFALDSTGTAHRLLSTSSARAVLTDDLTKKVVMDSTVSVSTTYNIARAQGEAMLSLYGRVDSALLKELARRIIENIRINLEK